MLGGMKQGRQGGLAGEVVTGEEKKNAAVTSATARQQHCSTRESWQHCPAAHHRRGTGRSSRPAHPATCCRKGSVPLLQNWQPLHLPWHGCWLWRWQLHPCGCQQALALLVHRCYELWGGADIRWCVGQGWWGYRSGHCCLGWLSQLHFVDNCVVQRQRCVADQDWGWGTDSEGVITGSYCWQVYADLNVVITLVGGSWCHSISYDWISHIYFSLHWIEWKWNGYIQMQTQQK